MKTWTVYYIDFNKRYRECCMHVSAETEQDARFKVNKKIGPEYMITKIYVIDSMEA